jgi:phosphoglycerol transferase MdoB-like AlkP superfamily enzyme
MHAWFSFALLLCIAVIWFRLYKRYRISGVIAVYHFVSIVGGLTIALIAARYQLLRYFSDNMDFWLASQLAGGSLFDAIRYGADEITLASALVVGALVIFLAGHFAIRAWARSKSERTSPVGQLSGLSPALRPKASRVMMFASIAAVLAVTAGIGYAARSMPQMTYGLSRTVAYTTLTQTASLLVDVQPSRFDVTPFQTARASQPAQSNVSLASVSPVAPVLTTKPSHLFVFVLESVRAEAIGKIVNGHPVTPNLTAMAEKGTYIPSAYSHAGYTAPSLTTLFNGALPGRGSPDQSLFATLKRLGYKVSVISGQDESFGGITKNTGMETYADYFFDARSAIEDRVHVSTLHGSLQLTEARLLRQLDSYLDETDPGQPQFIYFNVQAAHFPYNHRDMAPIITDKPIPRSEISADAKEQLALTYWNAVANGDRFIAEAISHLKAKGLYENALVVVLADHGESLFDDNFLGHGHALNDTQTRIPLLFNRPGITVTQPVGQDELHNIILSTLSREKPSPTTAGPQPKTVFQYIGTLDEPNQIGLVRRDGSRIVLDFVTHKVLFTDRNRWFGQDELLSDDQLKTQVSELVTRWNELRYGAISTDLSQLGSEEQ